MGSGGQGVVLEQGASCVRGRPVATESERGLAGELERAREALLGKDQQVQQMARELAGKDQQLQQMARELEVSLNVDTIVIVMMPIITYLLVARQALRREVRGVEVHDVEAGVSTVEERREEEPPAKRVRREQNARARVCGMYAARLVAVKQEQVEEGARRQAALKSEVDAKVKEALARVARAMECACCREVGDARGGVGGVAAVRAHLLQSGFHMRVGAGD